MKRIASLLVLALFLTSCIPGKTIIEVVTATPNTSQGVLPNFDHIILMVLENKGFSTAMDPKGMPNLVDLAQKNVLLANYYGISHPSLPNYLSLVSGSTQGATSDCTNCFVNQPNLADEIEKSGRTWKAYEESLPSPCFIGDADPYAQKHDPFLYFDSIRQQPQRCANIVPLTQLDGDLQAKKLPNFSFIMANLCNSGHNCPAATADTWVNQMVEKLQASDALGKNYLIAITFDEAADTDTSSCCGLSKGGGQVATVLISPTAKAGTYQDIAYSHYSLLKTFLQAWNLPDLGNTSQAGVFPIGEPWGMDMSAAAAAQSTYGKVLSSSSKGSNSAGNLIQTHKPVLTMGCSTTPFTTGGSLKICFSSPANSSTIQGDAQVKITEAVTGSSARVQQTLFYLDKKYLLTTFDTLLTFTLPTANFADGPHLLSAQAMLSDKSLSDEAGINLTFSNGGATPTPVPQFQPYTGSAVKGGSPFVVAAVGDGAGGGPNETKVTALLKSLNPNLFLYLGDVYERGSPAEFFNWYGANNTYYGQLRTITDPTIGNHDYGANNGVGYFNYWGNIPNYYSFDAGGWHFVSLNSNGSIIPTIAGSDQYKWLQQDLANNKLPCTVVYYHHPLFNIGPEGATQGMQDIWKLMAQDKVTLVLNGHDHDYQRWVPLDGNGQPASNGITEFIVGTGGHGLQKFVTTDKRVAYSNNTAPDAYGALLLTLKPDGASFSFENIAQAVIDSGTVQCNGN